MMTPEAQYRVLVVDDNPGDLLLLQEAVRSIHAPISLTTCPDGREALRILGQRSDFDLILSDLNMPGVNGVDLVHQLQQVEELRQIPIVMMSSSERAKLPKQLDGAITVPYFTKATTWDEFLGLARELVEAVTSKSSAASTSARILAERMTPSRGFAKFDGQESPS